MPGFRSTLRDERGFTLVELLVVVLCLGILAAMAIPSFLNQRAKAQDGAAKASARTARTAAETWFTNEQTYATLSPANLRTIESSLNDATLAVSNLSANTYTVSITSATSTIFRFNRLANGVVTRTCTPSGSGGCASNGSW
jgi:type IV pilus assembly protein PilA